MDKNNLKTLRFAIIFCLLLLFITINVAFAYTSQSIFRNHETKIVATDISFRINNKTYLDEIGLDELSLFKGEPTDTIMTVRVQGSKKIIVNYQIGFVLTSHSDITNAIEVYRYTNGRYDFLCMLNEIEKVVLDGVMVTDFDHSIELRFVYSGGADEKYDLISLGEGNNFIVKAVASASVSSKSDTYIFADSFDEFKKAFTSAENDGKTIVLTKNIAINEQLSSVGTVGIELNGNTLTLNENITINCGTGQSENRLGITNASQQGGIVANNNAFISVLGANESYLIDNVIQQSMTNGTIRVEIDANNYSQIFDDITKLIEKRTKKLNDSTLYYNGNNVSFIFDGLLSYFSIATPQDSAIQRIANDFLIQIDNEFTTKYLYAFEIAYENTDLGLNKATTISGYVSVRGNSPYAIAQHLLDKIPATINTNLYLAKYDAPTGSYIDWLINDGLLGNLLDNSGKYKKGGLESIIDSLDTFADKDIEIFVKVSKGTQTGTYMSFMRKCEVVSVDERMALIFDNLPVTIDVDNNYDIYNSYLLDKYSLEKMELIAIDVEILEDTKGYLSVVDGVGGTNFKAVEIKKSILLPQNTLTTAKLKITFTYGNSQESKTYSIIKDVYVSGEFAEITKYDMSYLLQSAFLGNNYTEGLGYIFYAYGALLPKTSGVSVPIFVDYIVSGIASEYISVTYEYVQVEQQDMNSQVCYFVLNGDNYEYAPTTDDDTQTYYERKANIEVLPSRITSKNRTTAYLTAVLYTIDFEGNPHTNTEGERIYIDPINGSERKLRYTLTLAVEGVVGNNDAQIADPNLYYIFRHLFDGNGDGIITTSEAEDWDGAVARAGENPKYIAQYTTSSNQKIHLINLSNLTIPTLKGVELFPNVQGYNLTNTGRADISILSELNNLVYLNISTTTARINSVTNLSPLAYLDKLEYLDLKYNRVSDLEPLRYLPNLTELFLDGNSVVNFEPLTELTTLKKLSILGMTTSNNANFTTDAKTMFDLALIKISSPNVGFTYSPTIVFSNAELVAGKVMRDIEEINRVKHVLYLPATYNYFNGTEVINYKFYWHTDVNEANLTLTQDEFGNVTYSILSPLYDKKITIFLKVYTPTQAGGDFQQTYAISREFTLTLETSSQSTLYIYNTKTGEYDNAMETIPDQKLRNLIFDSFNINASNSIIEGIGATEKNTISAYDINYLIENRQTLYNWSYKEISNLEGIGYLSDFFIATQLNLTGNPITDLTPLKNLASLDTLTLGGGAYDYRQLINVTSLTKLNAYDCFGLDTEETLNSLYELYVSNKSLNIYITPGGTVAWNPYTSIMPKKTQNLPTIATFSLKNDSFDPYLGNDSFDITIYGRPYQFKVTGATFHSLHNTNTMFFNWVVNKIVYGNTLLYNVEDSSYVQLTIRSTQTDGRGYISYGGYYLQLVVTDAGDSIFVHNVTNDGGFEAMTLNQLVGSRELNSASITAILTYIQNNPNRLIDFNPAIESNQEISTLLQQYPTASKYLNFYKNEKTSSYHITTDMLTLDGAINGNFGAITNQGTTLTIYSTYKSGTNALGGLRYFSGIKTLNILQDASLSDGAELQNIQNLTLNNSCIDFSQISTTLNNLTHINISNFYTFTPKDGDFSAFSHFPNLSSLIITQASTTIVAASANLRMSYIDDLSFLDSLVYIQEGQDKTNLETLSIYGVASTLATTATNASFVSRLFRASVNSGITPSYQIGSPSDATDNGYFRLIPRAEQGGQGGQGQDGQGGQGQGGQGQGEGGQGEQPIYEMWYCTDNSDATATLSWDSAIKEEMTVAELDDYKNVTNQMRDMGLKVNGNYWISSKTFNLSSSDILTLPATTGEAYYGLEFGQSGIKRSYYINWEIYHVQPSGETKSTLLYDSQNRTLYAHDYDNSYIVLVGTIANPLDGINNRAFMYHFIVGNGDGHYSKVTDITLRAWLFATEHSTSVITNAISTTTMLTNSTILSRMQKTALPSDNTSNHIYSFEGIADVVDFWAISRATTGRLKITSINFTGNHRATDASPLYVFENTKSLTLSGATSNYAYISIKNIGNSFPNLETLNIRYSVTTNPDDVKALTEFPRPKLSELNFNVTNVMNNRETIEYLKILAQNNINNSLKVQLQSTTPLTTVTLADIEDFLTSTQNAYPSGITASSNIVANGSETKIINGNSYAFTLVSGVASMLRSHAVANEIVVKMQVSSTKYPTFNLSYVTTVFRRADVTSPYRFGGLTIDHFDTELIGRLFEAGSLSGTNGNYLLNKNYTLSAINYGISSLNNVEYLADGNRVFIVPDTLAHGTALALLYKDPRINYLPPATQPTINDNVFSNPSDVLIYQKQLNSSYSYTNIVQSEYTALLPTHIHIGGVRRAINWTINTIINLNTTKADTILTITNNGVVYKLNADTIERVDQSANSSFTLTAKIEGTTLEYKKDITVNKYTENAVEPADYDFFVEVSTNGLDVIFTNSQDSTYHTIKDASQYSLQLYLSQGKYYYEQIPQSQPVTVINARHVFQSPKFAQYLYAKYFTQPSNIVYKSDINPVQAGYIISKADINARTEILIAYGIVTSNTSYQYGSQNITSIEGVQIFFNLKTFTAYGGAFTSIAPLTNLSLTTFVYLNSTTNTITAGEYGNNYTISDFSPLLVGSKHTLTQFGYNGGTVHITDLNFLLGFTNLQEVYIAVASPTYTYATGVNGAVATGLLYFKTPSGQYLLSTLYAKNIYVYAHVTLIDKVGLTYSTSITKTISSSSKPISFTSSYTVYALIPSIEYRLAQEVLSEFTPTHPAFANPDSPHTITPDSPQTTNPNPNPDTNPDIEQIDNFILNVKSTTTNNGMINFALPSTITHNGGLYLIDWKKASANITIIGYHLENDITINGTTYLKGMITNEQDIQTITNSIEYFDAYKSGQNKLTVLTQVNAGSQPPQTVFSRIVCRIYQSTFAYERMFTITFSE